MKNSTQNTLEVQTNAQDSCINADLQNGRAHNGRTLTAREAALAYRDAGFSVLPIKPDGSKAPALPRWKDLQERLPTDAELQANFRNGCGVAVIGGRVSGNLEILDFDEPGLYHQFAALCAEHGLGDLLESLPLVETPSGGHHLYYCCETAIEGNQNLATFQVLEGTPKAFPKDGKWWKCLIETRGEGGYAITYPTPEHCHPNNRPYQLLRGDLTAVPTIPEEQHSALINLARALNEYMEPSRVVGASLPKDADLQSGAIRPGDDYSRRGDYHADLMKHGWKKVGAIGEKILWRRPGKNGPGISATSNYAGSGLFHVFSTNAGPFEAMCAYTPFAVRTLLEHDGNFAAAARALAGEGYGNQLTNDKGGKGRARDNGESKSGVLNASNTFNALVDWPAPPIKAAYHGLAGDIVRAIAPHTEADPVALLAQFHVAFGNVVGRGPHFMAEADYHACNLFAVQVGPTAKGRKGTSWGHINRLFKTVAEYWSTNRVQSGLSSGEGLITPVRDPVEREEPIKDCGHLIGYETVVIDPGEKDKRLLVYEDEFASVLRVQEREGNKLSAIIRRAWDNGNLQTMTKTSLRATDAHISIIGHITKDELLRYMTSTEAGNGFANRFLWICVRRSQVLPEGGQIHDVDFQPLVKRLMSAVEFARDAGELRRDDEARAFWIEVYPKLSEGKPGLLGAVTARAEAQVMRLACIYALIDCSTVIRKEHLLAALALWDYSERSARFIFGDALGDPTADKILLALRDAFPHGLTLTYIYSDIFTRNVSARRIQAALNTLLQAGLARYEKAEQAEDVKEKGRPAEIWFAEDKNLSENGYALNASGALNDQRNQDEATSYVNRVSCVMKPNNSGSQDDEWEEGEV